MKKALFLAAALFQMNFASAGTLDQVSKASCKSTTGAFLEMDRSTQIFETQFADLPAMTNLADGERMPIEVQIEDKFMTLIAVVSDPATGFWGSAALYTPNGQDLKANETLPVIFRDWNGGQKTETLECALQF